MAQERVWGGRRDYGNREGEVGRAGQVTRDRGRAGQQLEPTGGCQLLHQGRQALPLFPFISSSPCPPPQAPPARRRICSQKA